MRFDRESWRRLYRHEPLEQRSWPLVTRAIRDHLIRYPDDLDGHLLSVQTTGGHGGGHGGGQAGDTSRDIESVVVQALCRALGVHDDERSLVERALRTLLGDRYLVCEGTGIVAIRNFGEAQQSKEARKKALQRSKKKGDNPGTPGGHVPGQARGHTGDKPGDTLRARDAGARTRGDLDETRGEEKEDSPPSRDKCEQVDGDDGNEVGSGVQPIRAKPRDAMAYMSEGRSEDRPDVKRLHEAWKSQFGLSGHKFIGKFRVDADTLAEAIDAHGIETCLRVLEHAPNDGMVSGRTDEKKEPHESIGYIFGNAQAFARILRDSEQRERASNGGSVTARLAAMESR